MNENIRQRHTYHELFIDIISGASCIIHMVTKAFWNRMQALANCSLLL